MWLPGRKLILCVLATITTCSAYRILAVFPYNGKSHNIIFESLVRGLVDRGHQVDHITHFPIEEPLKNYKVVINLDGTIEKVMNNYTIDFVMQISDNIDTIAVSYGNQICNLLGLKKFQRLIKNPPSNPPYDVVITEAFGANCYMGLGYVLDVPVVAVSSAMEYPWISHFTGNIDNLAIVPNSFANVGASLMNFQERLNNVYTNFMSLRKFHSLTFKNQTEAMRKYLMPGIPNIREVEKNIALTLVNNHPIISGVKPITPAMVQIAGIHIEADEQILTTELQEWMDKSKRGVVYFSFGSLVLIETLPKEVLTGIYDSLKKISPIKVLMKVVDSNKLPPGLPKNVKILPWMPQQAILAHENTILFITHGGLGSLEEALYYGVPMIGIPLFGDQFRNVETFVEKEMMIRIDYKKLSKITLDSALEALLRNFSYAEKAKYYSGLFRDQPLSPMDNAIFWIEYVVRNGAEVLKSPALELSWWQLDLLDVYGSVLIASLVGLWMVIQMIHYVFGPRKNVGQADPRKEKRH